MTTYRIEYTRRSLTDLTRIRDYVAVESDAGAASLIADILDAIDRLADTPHRTVVAAQPSGSLPPIRSVAIGSYMVYFRAIDRTRTVRVLRVRHGAKQPLRRFG